MPETPQSTPGRARLAQGLLWALGAMMLFSALAKLRQLGGFEAILTQLPGLGERRVAAWVARALVIGELSLGLALFQAVWRRRVVVPLLMAVLAIFSLYLVVQMGRGAEGSCGCFGALLPMSHGAALTKNLLALAVAAVAWRGLPSDPPFNPAPLLLTAFSLALVLVAFPMTMAKIPMVVDQRAGDPPPASPLERFITPEFPIATGDTIVAFLSLDCEHCQKAAADMAALPPGAAKLPRYYLFLGDAEAVPDFFQTTGVAVPYRLLGPKDFFDFVSGAPPAVYLLREGQVRQVWQGEAFNTDALISAMQ
jgi:hypothetical protein